jgi:hypothetical protein
VQPSWARIGAARGGRRGSRQPQGRSKKLLLISTVGAERGRATGARAEAEFRTTEFSLAPASMGRVTLNSYFFMCNFRVSSG